VGEENRGVAIVMSGLDLERAMISPICLGIAERALDLCIDYAKTREQFGKPIASFQMIQSKLADIYVWVETMRTFNYRVLAAANAVESGWKGLLSISELTRDYASRYGDLTARKVMDYMVEDERNPSSICSCLMAARENARAVRGTLKTPIDGYLVTGGILNLETAANADKAWEQIETIVKEDRGRLLGYVIPSDKSTKPLGLAQTVAGWTAKGHYLAYCVVARKDGVPIEDGDPFAKQIMFDIVQFYLQGQILEARATDPIVEGATPPPSGQPSP